MFPGYNTCELYASMKNASDIEPAFVFARENQEIINDTKILGILNDFPSKVKLLQGLVPVMNKFIDAVESLKRKSNQECSVVPKRKKKCPEKKQNFQEADCDPVLNLLRSNMVAWFDRQQNATVIAQQIGYKLLMTMTLYGSS